jgi:ATP-dependent Clp protease ATP-binding subunit ClpB
MPVRPEDLTDLDEVRANLREPAGPRYLDEVALLERLSAHVRGQDDALRTLARAVCHHLARRSPARPATLFAVGPTGVGKTKTAESLPLALQALDPDGIGYGFLRLDMPEYQERYRVSQLLGSPQGYVGYGEGAQLADALSANPRTIVLFDEIEKAHPDVLRALMNAMDAGRLSTAQRTERGRELDCRRAIFLFTSNLDASGILNDLEQRSAFGNPAVADEVCRRHLRGLGIKPELIGRIQRFLVFRPLSASTRAEIVGLAIVRVAAEYGVHIGRIDPDVIVAILNRVQSDGFGARPDEYLVDEMLGPVFVQAAATMHSPVEIRGGPPFECVPLTSPAGVRTH